ncbi:FAD:protein FMN transferase [candidate division KSB1 bacterium]|nr:FAD:protein FMN transferase [candidate division KSB1 bacterium]
MKRKILGLLFLLFISSCQKSTSLEPIEATRFLMDTVVRIAVYDFELSSKDTEKAIDQAFEAMKEVEEKTSAHRPESDVSLMIRSSGGEAIAISEETKTVLQEAVFVSEATDGAFDATVGVVKDLWGFYSDAPKVPALKDIDAYLPLIDYHQIELSGEKARLQKKNAGLDLGGIVKGFNIDRAVEVLQSAGVKSAMVDAGGDLRIIGSHPKNPHWRIGIKHPRPDHQSLYGVIETNPVSVATSGDYERFFMHDGKRYHHILDPKTGMPASGCVSVTIVTEMAMRADAYATAVFVMGPERGMAFIESHPDLEGLILFEEGHQLKMVVSEGLRNKVQLL